MKRFVVILISTIVAIALIFTGIIVHQKRSRTFESIEVEKFRAPPEGLNEEQVIDFFNNNSTVDESPQFEDGKEVVEEQASYAYCKYYKVSGTYSSRSSCYSALYNKGCKRPCLILTNFIYNPYTYTYRYTCQCWQYCCTERV